MCINSAPTSAEESLRARFLEIVNAKPIQWNPSFLWGKWLMLVASRLGRSTALDDATLCFISGCYAQQNRTFDNVKRARIAYGRALSSVHRALSHADPRVSFSSEVIAGIKFLTAFEVKDAAYTCHSADLIHCRPCLT